MKDLNYYDSHTKEIRKQCELICSMMIPYKLSIRQTAEMVEMSKSSVHNYIHTYIKDYYPDEYAQIVDLLKYNYNYRRRARKFWRK